MYPVGQSLFILPVWCDYYTSLTYICILTKQINFQLFSTFYKTKKLKTLDFPHIFMTPFDKTGKEKKHRFPVLFRSCHETSGIRTSEMQESKSCALPLGDSPLSLIQGGYRDSNPGPPEPQSGALTNCAIPTIYSHRPMWPGQTCPKGFEPLTHGLEGRCSIQLSYEHITFVSSRRTYHSSRILY